MTQFLPPNLLALFAPRDPIPYLSPASKLPHEKKNGGYIGVGNFLKHFEVNTPKYFVYLFIFVYLYFIDFSWTFNITSKDKKERVKKLIN